MTKQSQTCNQVKYRRQFIKKSQ